MTQDACLDTSSNSNEPKTEPSASPPWTEGKFPGGDDEWDLTAGTTIDPTRSYLIHRLVDALAKAQAKITAPERNRTVRVKPRDQSKAEYSFKYATLDHIIEVIRGPLTENGLWFTQIMKEDGGTYILDTRLMHESGQWIACQTPLLWDGNGGNQQFGSALTFMRRYSLTSLLGIAAEEDDDANAADGNEVLERKPNMPRADVMIDVQSIEGIIPPLKQPPPSKLEVTFGSSPTDPDWASFGRTLISYIRGSKDIKEAEQWYVINDWAIVEMQKSAPKMYTNLNTSIVKIMNELREKEGK